jgi:hypothetical protein
LTVTARHPTFAALRRFAMKSLALFLITVALLTTARAEPSEKKRFVLYATLLQETPVDLADGAQWLMDRGDTFPVVMFKEQQTKALLQLAGTTFLVDVKRLKIIQEKDLTAGQLASYRHNVQTYIDTRSDQWKQRAATK